MRVFNGCINCFLEKNWGMLDYRDGQQVSAAQDLTCGTVLPVKEFSLVNSDCGGLIINTEKLFLHHSSASLFAYWLLQLFATWPLERDEQRAVRMVYRGASDPVVVVRQKLRNTQFAGRVRLKMAASYLL